MLLLDQVLDTKKQMLDEIPINKHIKIDEIESKDESFIDWIINFFNLAS